MSYSMELAVKIDGTNKYATICRLDANITYNVCEMIRKSTGLDWHSHMVLGLAKDIMPKIKNGKLELMFHADRYKKYESPNGWGTVDGTIDFFDKLIDEWNDFKTWHEDIADYVFLAVE